MRAGGRLPLSCLLHGEHLFGRMPRLVSKRLQELKLTVFIF
ncbi:hypothetical protein VC87395_000526 [Vibrio paracholerae 87395]|nr:hypothetical protein VCCP103710_0524 [Vibrio cholerae CP1037(10)]EMP94190.1 hypothetical protein VC87395_000526 [Vibrio paracholerae 87395]ERP70467.1 hypothetical protein VCHC36A1_0655 [Vibrio cholerae HC-36A1]CPR26711.1 FIG01201049: hypothetical protein [Vibrio cholerae]CPR26712.1 FIG01201049: hypothetical protein [Vibrio cholerae]